jgi:hypothetical protein
METYCHCERHGWTMVLSRNENLELLSCGCTLEPWTREYAADSAEPIMVPMPARLHNVTVFPPCPAC